MLAVGGHVLDDLQPQCVRMATPLAGGLGSTHYELCGALAGGAMVIGALLGRSSADEDDATAQAMAREFRSQFLAEMGHTQCAQIRDWVHQPDGPGTCAVIVEKAAHILLQLLDA